MVEFLPVQPDFFADRDHEINHWKAVAITFAPMSMDPKNISIASYSYVLPEDRIAQYPLADRDASKLLVFRSGKITDDIFRSLPDYIVPGSLVVFNSTKVVRARILMHRATGGLMEIFCTDAADVSNDFTRMLQQTGSADVLAYVGNVRRWRDDEELILEFGAGHLRATKLEPVSDQWKVRLTWTPETLTFAEVLDAVGKIPLPPYMHREEESGDAERYQTVFASDPGSVAAPTASLHITDRILEQLRAQQIEIEHVTLHVGAGTFKPVKSATIGGHEMHREKIIVTRALVDQLIAHNHSTVIAAGTTALRAIESIYWFGRQLVLNPGQYRSELFVGQWEPYDNGPKVPVPVALRAIADWMREYKLHEFSGYTEIMIVPGYRFKIVNGLITNFHQPQSTLLLLVAAFVGENYLRIYNHALLNNYRFLSYGDGSLLYKYD